MRRAVFEQIRRSGSVVRGRVRCLPGLGFGEKAGDGGVACVSACCHRNWIEVVRYSWRDINFSRTGALILPWFLVARPVKLTSCFQNSTITLQFNFQSTSGPRLLSVFSSISYNISIILPGCSTKVFERGFNRTTSSLYKKTRTTDNATK